MKGAFSTVDDVLQRTIMNTLFPDTPYGVESGGDPVCIAAIQLLTVAVISGVLAFIAEEPGWDKLRAAAVPILYCGIMSGGVGYTLQMVAQRYTDPTVASLLMSLESVFAVLGGALLLHERMSGRELLAIILVQIPMPKREGALSAE